MILNLGNEESVMFKILNKKVLHENILLQMMALMV